MTTKMQVQLPVIPISPEKVQRMEQENKALRDLVLRIEEMARRTGNPETSAPLHRRVPAPASSQNGDAAL